MCGPDATTDQNNPQYANDPNYVYSGGRWQRRGNTVDNRDRDANGNLVTSVAAHPATPADITRGERADTNRAFNEALDTQTRANRPDITTPWATSRWTQTPDGRWSLNTAPTGQMSQLLNQPFDWTQFGAMPDGDRARESTINSAATESMRRLQPQWADESRRLQQRLANQGLGAGSAAGLAAMRTMQGGQEGARLSALANAVSEGNRAGHQTFADNMAVRNQRLSEALRRRQLPWDEMNQASGLMGMPQFNAAGRGASMDFRGTTPNPSDMLGGIDQTILQLLPLLLRGGL